MPPAPPLLQLPVYAPRRVAGSPSRAAASPDRSRRVSFVRRRRGSLPSVRPPTVRGTVPPPPARRPRPDCAAARPDRARRPPSRAGYRSTSRTSDRSGRPGALPPPRRPRPPSNLRPLARWRIVPADLFHALRKRGGRNAPPLRIRNTVIAACHRRKLPFVARRRSADRKSRPGAALHRTVVRASRSCDLAATGLPASRERAASRLRQAKPCLQRP